MKIPMVSKTCLFTPELFTEIASFADSQDISWAAALRLLVERGLDCE